MLCGTDIIMWNIPHIHIVNLRLVTELGMFDVFENLWVWTFNYILIASTQFN